MCTLTWQRDESGYSIHFNRDERRTRAPSRPPAPLETGGLRALAPIDGEAGGTWIGVNDRGVAIALLNGYQHPRHAAEGVFRSRGALVVETLAARSARDAIARVAADDMARYRPFVLAAFDTRDARYTEWTGESLVDGDLLDAMRPLVSSGYDFEGVRRVRRALFLQHTRGGSDVDDVALARFHAAHEPERGPYSPCMHREDAATMSYTRLHVVETEARLSHRAGAPCEPAAVIEAMLPLARASRG